MSRRINAIARSLRRAGETRTMDQIRADVYIDLLNGKDYRTDGGAVIHLTADLDTLAGLTDHPGELNGFAPVISDIARQIAVDQGDAEWRFTVTDTETGRHMYLPGLSDAFGRLRHRPHDSIFGGGRHVSV